MGMTRKAESYTDLYSGYLKAKPFQGLFARELNSQGSSVLPDWHHSQAWALMRNPFGIMPSPVRANSDLLFVVA